MQVAAKAALMRQTLSPDITSDAKTPGQVTFNVTPKGKDKVASSTHQNAQAGSSNTETIKPITVDLLTPRTIIPRSQWFTIFAPVINFATDDTTAIKKSLFELYTSSIVSIKWNKDITILVNFCVMDNAH